MSKLRDNSQHKLTAVLRAEAVAVKFVACLTSAAIGGLFARASVERNSCLVQLPALIASSLRPSDRHKTTPSPIWIEPQIGRRAQSASGNALDGIKRVGSVEKHMTEAEMREASNLLYHHWKEQTRIDALPRHLRPASRAEGYRVQALLEEHTSQPLFGWKIAATSIAGQNHINVDGPLAGRLLAERVIADGGTCPLGNNLNAGGGNGICLSHG